MSSSQAKAAVRTERRVVRPFAGLGDVEECLAGTTLTLNGEPIDKGTDSVVREESDLREDEFHLILDIDTDRVAAAVERTGIPEVDVGVVVLGTGRSLKATAILHRCPVLSGDLPESIALSRVEHPDIFGDLRGFDVRVCIVLLHDLQPRPLRPHMAGTWLAARDFSVRAQNDVLSGFSPQRLNDELRNQYGLLPDTTSYLYFTGTPLLESTDLSECMSYFLDATVFDALHASQSTPIGLALQSEFIVELLVGAIGQIVNELDEQGQRGHEDALFGEQNKTPAAALVRRVASGASVAPSVVCDWSRTEPARLRAMIQGNKEIELTKRLRAAIKQGGE